MRSVIGSSWQLAASKYPSRFKRPGAATVAALEAFAARAREKIIRVERRNPFNKPRTTLELRPPRRRLRARRARPAEAAPDESDEYGPRSPSSGESGPESDDWQPGDSHD